MTTFPRVQDGQAQLRAKIRARCVACRIESAASVRSCPRCSKANELYCGVCLRTIPTVEDLASVHCAHCTAVAYSAGASMRARILAEMGTADVAQREAIALRERFRSLAEQFSLPPRVGAFVPPIPPVWEKVPTANRRSLRARFDEVMVADAQVRREVESALRGTINFDTRIAAACDAADAARLLLTAWDGMLVEVRDQTRLETALATYVDSMRSARQMLERLKERDLSRALDLDAARARALVAFNG